MPTQTVARRQGTVVAVREPRLPVRSVELIIRAYVEVTAAYSRLTDTSLGAVVTALAMTICGAGLLGVIALNVT